MDICQNLYKPWNVRGCLYQSNHWFRYLKRAIHSYLVRNDDRFQDFPEIYGKIHSFIVYLKALTFDHYIRREMAPDFREFLCLSQSKKKSRSCVNNSGSKGVSCDTGTRTATQERRIRRCSATPVQCCYSQYIK